MTSKQVVGLVAMFVVVIAAVLVANFAAKKIPVLG